MVQDIPRQRNQSNCTKIANYSLATSMLIKKLFRLHKALSEFNHLTAEQ